MKFYRLTLIVSFIFGTYNSIHACPYHNDFTHHQHQRENSESRAGVSQGCGLKFNCWVDQTLDFWVPRVTPILNDARDFWTPVLQDSADFWDDVFLRAAGRFDRDIHPRIKGVIQEIDDRLNISYRTRQITDQTLSFWAPIVRQGLKDSQDFWTDQLIKHSPHLYYWLRDIPAFLKQAVDAYMMWVLEEFYFSDSIDEELLPEWLRSQYAMLSSMTLITNQNHPDIKRLQRLLEDIRPYAKDYGMQDCYRVILVEADFANALNVGCHNLVTTPLVKMLDDDELRAVLAHELAHGDHGHLVKNLWMLATGIGVHLVDLLREEAIWLLTGEIGDRLAAVLAEGNMPPIIAAFASKAPEIEIEADQTAALILERAGFKRQSLKSALIKLHGLSGDDVIAADNSIQEGDIRNYPSLYARLQAIDRASGRRWR